MTKEELKKLFEKYDLFTLDSLNILIGYLDESQIKEVYPIFKRVYQEKYKMMEKEFEGINEYDFHDKVLNFDIQDIIDGIESLNKNELNFLDNIVSTALSKIDKKNEVNYKINYCLIKYQEESNAYHKYTIYSKNTIDSNMTDEELKKFFDKYNVIELEHFITLFDNARFDFNVYRLYKIYKMVSNNKDIYKEYPTSDKYYEALEQSKISDLKYKNKLLNNKELKFLYTLVDSASDFLSFVNNCNYEDLIMDIDKLDYSIIEEIENRNAKDLKVDINLSEDDMKLDPKVLIKK